MAEKTISILTINNLKLETLDGTRILDGINFNLKQNEIHGLLGVSGSGKSMTALSILQLLNQEEKFNSNGNINLNGEYEIDILHASDYEKSQIRANQISIVFQNAINTFNPSQKCFNQLLESVYLSSKLTKQEAKAKVRKYIKWVNLHTVPHVENAFPHQLSGGQLQRLLIAMALIKDPKILIVDEATTALDNITQMEILNLLSNAKNEFGVSIIFISHDIEVLSNISDRISILWEGKILETRLRSELNSSLIHPFTNALLFLNTCFAYSLEKLPTLEDLIEIKNIGTHNQLYLKEFSVKQFIQKNRKNRDRKRPDSFLIQAKSIFKSYKSSGFSFVKTKPGSVIKNLDFNLTKGSITGIVGESGCGKSTLAKILVGIEKMDSGFIYFDDKILNLQNKKELKDYRKSVQIIFQDPKSSLDPLLSIGESIIEVVRLKELGNKIILKDKAIEILATVGLPEDLFNRYPSQLSGGQCQRVCIARALILEPKVIICDEIVSSLDLFSKAKVLNILLEQVRCRDMGVVFITHDLKVLRFLADYIYVMKDGEFIEEGEKEFIFQESREPYTMQLIKSIPKSLTFV